MLAAKLRRRFVRRRLTEELVIVSEPLCDDLVNFRRKAKTDMGRADFDVLHVRTVVIDTSLPCNDGIRPGVNRRHGCTE